jgi:G3E family GTPase
VFLSYYISLIFIATLVFTGLSLHLQHLQEQRPDGAVNEAVQQVAFADKILLNKIDLVSTREKADLLRYIETINAGAAVIECRNSQVDLEQVLSQHAFDLEKILAADPAFLKVRILMQTTA